jgi:hypothetical protein
VRHARLAERHSPTRPQLSYHLTLHNLLFPRPRLPFKRADPAHVPHGSLDIFDVELVFKANGEAVEGSDGGVVLGVVVVQLLRGGDGGVEEDLVEAVKLCG